MKIQHILFALVVSQFVFLHAQAKFFNCTTRSNEDGPSAKKDSPEQPQKRILNRRLRKKYRRFKNRRKRKQLFKMMRRKKQRQKFKKRFKKFKRRFKRNFRRRNSRKQTIINNHYYVTHNHNIINGDIHNSKVVQQNSSKHSKAKNK